MHSSMVQDFIIALTHVFDPRPYSHVKAIKPYGAFVEIRGMSGLLHISQISFDRIEDLPSIMQMGMKIKCMIIDHDKVRLQLICHPGHAFPVSWYPWGVYSTAALIDGCARNADVLVFTFYAQVNGRIALSTKTLEPEPGDMIKNPDKVYEMAEVRRAR